MQHSFIENDEEIPLEFLVPEQYSAVRLDKVLAQLLPEYSRGRIQGWIERERVTLNGKPAKVKMLVYPFDRLIVRPEPAPEEMAFHPDPEVRFDVFWENQDCLVVQKPPGLVVHPGAGNWEKTLLNGLLHRYPELLHVPRAGIVHRLDKDTSGLMVVAKNIIAQTYFVRLLQSRAMKREYTAFVQGHIPYSADWTCVSAPIGRDKHHPTRMTINDPIAAKEAITYYRVQAHGTYQGQPVSKVICRLETGRTHQIRVHMAAEGYPLVADVVYGGSLQADAQRQMLHAYAIAFIPPQQSDLYTAQIALPADMQHFEQSTEWEAPCT